MVYTSYKREGESVFAFPEGCPEGGRRRAEGRRPGASQAPRGTARGEGKPILSRPLVGGTSFFFIMSFLSKLKGMFIPPLTEREGMIIPSLPER